MQLQVAGRSPTYRSWSDFPLEGNGFEHSVRGQEALPSSSIRGWAQAAFPLPSGTKNSNPQADLAPKRRSKICIPDRGFGGADHRAECSPCRPGSVPTRSRTIPRHNRRARGYTRRTGGSRGSVVAAGNAAGRNRRDRAKLVKIAQDLAAATSRVDTDKPVSNRVSWGQR